MHTFPFTAGRAEELIDPYTAVLFEFIIADAAIGIEAKATRF